MSMEMKSYKCDKCGEGCISKNPAIRNVFPDDNAATVMTNVVNVRTRQQPLGRVVTFEFPMSDAGDIRERPNDELELYCANMIRRLTDDMLKHWLCDHEWQEVSSE